jgi:FkbM family methyltransferase
MALAQQTPAPKSLTPFADIVAGVPILHVVDVGSNPHENAGNPPVYAALLRAGRCRVTGFQPGADAFAALEKTKGPMETYYPYAIGDGTTQNFYECALPVMSSLYEPDPNILKHFYVLDMAAKVKNISRIDTKKLDDIDGIRAPDFLHMDVQGAEHQVLTGAPKLLDDILVVQAETLFLPMYKNQPMFSEVEMLLRARGFMLHRFNNPQVRTWRPACLGGNVLSGWAQLFWCDSVFVRSVTTWDSMPADALLKMAALMHDLYVAFDMVLLILLHRDRAHKTRDAAAYIAWMSRDFPQLLQMPS